MDVKKHVIYCYVGWGWIRIVDLPHFFDGQHGMISTEICKVQYHHLAKQTIKSMPLT
jgi:hypothetical protein